LREVIPGLFGEGGRGSFGEEVLDGWSSFVENFELRRFNAAIVPLFFKMSNKNTTEKLNREKN